MAWVHGFVLPADIPADAVELLRFLLSSSKTKESSLEDWLRRYPQVLNARKEDLYPKTRFSLPFQSSPLPATSLGFQPQESRLYFPAWIRKRFLVPSRLKFPVYRRWSISWKATRLHHRKQQQLPQPQENAAASQQPQEKKSVKLRRLGGLHSKQRRKGEVCPSESRVSSPINH